MVTEQIWREVYDGGSPEAEEVIFNDLARRIVRIQRSNKDHSGAAREQRTFHAKIVVGVNNATLSFDDRMPRSFQIGALRPGANFPAAVRLSNANGTSRSDHGKDMRGIALRVTVSNSDERDLLMTSLSVSHARNARQFVGFAEALSGSKLMIVPRLLTKFGPRETTRMLRNVLRGARRSESLALESYWSRGAILWGEAGPVRFRLTPLGNEPKVMQAFDTDPECLSEDFASRLRWADVRYTFSLQPYVNERVTPIEDGAIEWCEQASPFLPVGVLQIPRQDLRSASAMAMKQEIDSWAFNPWNTPSAFRPLGNLNRARRRVYAASAAGWLAVKDSEPSLLPTR